MSWAWLLGLAWLLVWALGAYNRLVRLRQSVVTSYALLDADWQDGLQQAMVASGLAHQLEPVRSRLLLALASSRSQLFDVAALSEVALAQQQLLQALEQQQLASCLPRDRLRMRAEQFNAAVDAYQAAISLFPASLLARLVGFRPAICLPIWPPASP